MLKSYIQNFELFRSLGPRRPGGAGGAAQAGGSTRLRGQRGRHRGAGGGRRAEPGLTRNNSRYCHPTRRRVGLSVLFFCWADFLFLWAMGHLLPASPTYLLLSLAAQEQRKNSNFVVKVRTSTSSLRSSMRGRQSNVSEARGQLCSCCRPSEH